MGMRTRAQMTGNGTFNFYCMLPFIFILHGSRLVCGKGNRSSGDGTSVVVNIGIFTVVAEAAVHSGSEIYKIRFCQAKQNTEGLYHTIPVLCVNSKEMYVSMNMCGVMCVVYICQ